MHNDEKYTTILETMKDYTSNLSTDAANYVKCGWIKRFKLETCDGAERAPERKSGTEVVQLSPMFDVIHDVQMQMGHAGRNKMEAECKRRSFTELPFIFI